jgi:uncharacterized protein involved in oxidation of intracellular sulfur
MKIGIILGTNDPEVVFNAFRFGVLALRNDHSVRIFLMNRGVEIEDIDSPAFNVHEQVFLFTKKQGEILSCMTSMKAQTKRRAKSATRIPWRTCWHSSRDPTKHSLSGKIPGISSQVRQAPEESAALFFPDREGSPYYRNIPTLVHEQGKRTGDCLG